MTAWSPDGNRIAFVVYHDKALGGNADTLVDISYSRRAYDAYRDAAETALKAGEISVMPQIAFHEVDGAGHIFTRPKHNQDAVQAVTAFLADRSGEPS